MPGDLTREEIELMRVGFDRGRDLGYIEQRALLGHALAEPTRLAAARAEGVREGIEMAAQVASNAAWRYEDDDASMTGGPEAGARYQVGECVKAIKALSPVPTWTPTHRHYKGGLYREIMRCEGADGDDLVPVVIYENEVGRRFARDAAVFDGQIVKQDAGGLPYLDVRRFEPIAPAPAEAPTTPTVDALTDAWRLAEQDKARVAALEAENAKLREGLEFYADPDNYIAISFLSDPPCGEFMDDFDEDHGNPLFDRPMPGKRARTLLQGQGGADGR